MQSLHKHCACCGAHFRGSSGRRYCSVECREASRKPGWNKGTKGRTGRAFTGEHRACQQCGSTFYVSRSQAAKLDPKYCSRDCYYAARWGGGRTEERICPVCGTAFVARLSQTKVCCSLACRREHFSNIRRGERSHFWRGGATAPYHKDWKAARREALQRDNYRCVECGSTERLSVHHVVPYRYSHSHDLDNLLTLCRSCHSKAELKVNPPMKAGLGRRWEGR